MMVTEYYMSNKSPEKVSDEDYKVATTSADKPILNKQKDKGNVQTGENYELPAAQESKEGIVQEELN